MRLISTLVTGSLLAVSTFVGGCQHERHTAIPPSAIIAGESNGRLLTYRAGDNGMVYLFNRNTDKLIYSGVLNKGEAIVVNKDKNQVLIDDRIISEGALRRGDTYRIFFDATNATGQHNAM